jgi:hypothetical protein
MDTGVVNEFAEVMQRVKGWSPDLRIALAKGILDSLQPARVAETAHIDSAQADAGMRRATPARKPKRGPSAAEVQSLFRTDRPAPDDETVERWIDEQRMEKYGR